MKKLLWVWTIATMASSAQAWTGRGEAPSFAGTWRTTYGVMKLSQHGDRVSGFYLMGAARCRVEGQVQGGRLAFRYHEPHAVGVGWFQLSPGGRSFRGMWRQQGQQVWRPWVGHRGASARASAPAFAGLWKTTFGTLFLVQQGNRVRGLYAYGGGSYLTGTVAGDKLIFHYRERGAVGEGWFQLSPDGHSFTGRWRALGAQRWSSWNGRRGTGTTGSEPGGRETRI